MKTYKIVNIVALFLLTSCNLSMTMVHTAGTASDVVDDTSEVSPDVSADISVPVSGI